MGGCDICFGVKRDNQNRMCKLNSVYCWSRVLLFNTIHTLRWYQTWLPSLYTGCQLLVVIMEPIFSQSLVIWCPGAWTVAHFLWFYSWYQEEIWLWQGCINFIERSMKLMTILPLSAKIIIKLCWVPCPALKISKYSPMIFKL